MFAVAAVAVAVAAGGALGHRGAHEGASGWGPLDFLDTCDDQTFRAFVTPVALMTRLSYTATYGSYYNASEANSTVAGYARVMDLERNPKAGGMHALVFASTEERDQTTDTRRVVIAFRGTDLSPVGVSGQADECADIRLWDSHTKQEPAYCSKFDNYTLDYLGRALDMTGLVQDRFPDAEILMTGHSLGAGLANLVAVLDTAPSYPRPVVSFSSPGVLEALRAHAPGPFNPHDVNTSRTFVLADEWDPIFHKGNATLLGTTCQWNSKEPETCRVCYAEHNENSLACLACFETQHVYKHYLALLDVPRPQCHTHVYEDRRRATELQLERHY